ncbi:MAG: D-aminoacylase [Fimbriimonadaceae bacterium]|nr:D-aminoacylase [Fimbriimonadaceae bacterium]
MLTAGFLAVTLSKSLMLPTYDLVIRNGMVIDGSGNPAYYADIAINSGVIQEIGTISETGKQEIDANNMAVTPGFIDVHTHAENVIELPNAENFVRMGVTSIVIGNCGGSELDLGSFFAKLEKDPVSVNVASLVGQNTVRRSAMGGNFDRLPSDSEMTKMKASVRRAMEDGAVGLSTGLIYLPGAYSKTEEIIELAKIAGEYRGVYATHMRSEGTNIFSAIEEMIRIGVESKCRVEYSHIKLSGENVWGRTNEVLARLEKARAEGLEITQDQYAYTASSTSISTLLPDSALEGGTAELKKKLDDPIQRAAIAKDMTDRLALRKRTDYGYAVIASCRADSRLNGKNLIEAAQIRLGKSTLADQIETVFWIQLNGGASAVFHGMSEPDVTAFMQHPNTMIACDASCREYGEGVPHPRGYGNNARVLGRYVRELKTIRLEDAVRKMTSLPAQTFRLKNRGILKVGMAADINIFDPALVTDPSTYVDPHKYSTGFKAVIVNGKLVVKNDEHTGVRSGVPLRREGYKTRSTVQEFHSTIVEPADCCAGA